MKYFSVKQIVGVALLASLPIFAAGEKQFATPEDAVQALATAARAHDSNALNEIFGPELHQLVSSDAVQASNRFKVFVERISAKTSLIKTSGDRVDLEIGYDQWPFPIPIERRDNQWFFDTAAGKEEILNRRIGQNEFGAINVCRAYVEAQQEYADEIHADDGVRQYAQSLRSTPGKHDGLYWHAEAGEQMSPLGPLVAEARNEGYRHESKIMAGAQKPYHGYYFKILARQGKHAPGGKFNYVINGRMLAGFALVAWPAEWGNTGVMTFIVNQDGKIYQKCLEHDTAKVAARMTTFDPDASWKAVDEP